MLILPYTVKQSIFGFILVILIGITGTTLSKISGDVLNFENTPFSPILICILIGIVINHFFNTTDKYQYVINFGIEYVLKWGIILLGISISLVQVIQIGAQIIPIVIITIFSGILLAFLFAKLFKGNHVLFMLIGLGTAICGITAIAAASPIINAKKEQSTYAISVVAILGTITMATYPYLVNSLFTDVMQIGVFLGTSIHDTSQALGAGIIYSQIFDIPRVLDVAIITKLIRNSFIIVGIPVVAYLSLQDSNNQTSARNLNYKKIFPIFMLGFLAMAFLRSIVDYGIEENFISNSYSDIWQNVISTLNFIAKKIFLVFALTCVGLSTNIKNISKIGLQPLLAGFFIAVLLAVINSISIYGLL